MNSLLRILSLLYDILILLTLSVQMSLRWRRRLVERHTEVRQHQGKQIDAFDVVAVAITVENQFQFHANGAVITHDTFL